MLPRSQPPPRSPDSDSTLARGLAIGRYVVLGLVGRGGMGDVYAAYDPELDRKVAIKLLRARSRSRANQEGSDRARMLREAQAIARLTHPNVVGVYDVGTFQGHVFIAMEFVDGQTVGYWMNAQTRSWPDVLKVFIAAGRGLSAAHDKKLIHRDFKPDNVMVSADGEVRVMDFGLVQVASDQRPSPGRLAALKLKRADFAADGSGSKTGGYDLGSTRILDTHQSVASPPDELDVTAATVDSQLTQTGSLLGTPAYMAPEQFQRETTDARTDQFSFCVALHEALYGERPFVGKTFRTLSSSVVQGRVRPAPANTKVPQWLRKVLLRGLKTRPEDRWPSMTALLAELEMHRAVEGRHRFAVGAATKLVGIWEAPVRARRRETVAKGSIRKAFLATGRHYAADAFKNVGRVLDRYATDWSEMFVNACEAHARGEQSAEVLDLRMAALHEALAALRALSDAFRGATAETVENAVDAANALPRIERCADVKLLRAVVTPPDDPTIRAAVDRIRGQLAEVRMASRVGQVAAALKAIGPLEQEVRQLGYDPLVAEVLLERASVLMERGDWEAAGRILEEAVWLAELSRHDEVAAEAATQLVGIMAFQTRFDAADIWSRHAETILRRMGGQDRLWAWLFNNRGVVRQCQGRLGDGLAHMQQAIAAKEKAFGSSHPDVALSQSNVAVLMVEMGQLTEALPCVQRAIANSENSLGPDHPRTASFLVNGGEILNKLGRHEEARGMAQRALSIFEREAEADGAFVTTALVALGVGYLDDGMVDAALPLLERAAKNRETNETELSRLAEAHFALARALSRPGHDQERARALALRARTECEQGAQSPACQRALAAINQWLSSQSS